MSSENGKTTLKGRSFTAVLWSGADLGLRQGLTLVISIILARLLEPEEFGTIALLFLFMGLSNVFINSGFSGALIQKSDATHTDESTVFWFNTGMGAIVGGVLCLVAPWIAAFYEKPILIPMTYMTALSLFINALGGIQLTILMKKLEFKTPMKVGFAATVISGIVAIYMAYTGYGVWALVAQELVRSIVNTVLLWVLHNWRPKATFSIQSGVTLYRFGGYLMLSGILDVAFNQVHTLIIGKLYGVRELGFFGRATRIQQIPVQLISDILSRVAFPIFSAAADNTDKLKRGVRFAISGIMLLNIPLMLGLMITSKHLVHVVFGAKWLPSVPLLQILCVVGLFWPLQVINLNVLKAQGHSDLFFKLEIIKKVFGTIFLIIGVYFGVTGIAWSQAAFAVVAFFINAFYTERFLKYGAWKQIYDMVPIFIVSIVVMGIVFIIGNYMSLSSMIILVLQVTVGVVCYFLLCHFLKLIAYKNVIELFQQKFSPKSI